MSATRNANRPQLPENNKYGIVPLTPDKVALAITKDDALTNATEVDITLNGDTKIVRVTSLDNGIFLKYAATATSTDFDEYIPAGNTFDYVVPNGVTVVSIIGDEGTARARVIQK